RDAAAVEGIGGVGSRRDRLVVAGSGTGEVAIVEIEQAKFFVVAGRRIIQDSPLEFANAPPPRESLKGSAEQPGIGNDFGHNVNQSPNPAQEQDDKYPIGIRPAADEMH